MNDQDPSICPDCGETMEYVGKVRQRARDGGELLNVYYCWQCDEKQSCVVNKDNNSD